MAGEAALTDWEILWRLGALVLLAVIVGVPAQIRVLAAVRGTNPPDWRAYAGPTIILAVIGLLAAVAGTVAAARVGLEAPALHPSAGNPVLPALVRHFGWGVAGGLLVAIVVSPFYYGIMRSCRPASRSAAYSRRSCFDGRPSL